MKPIKHIAGELSVFLLLLPLLVAFLLLWATATTQGSRWMIEQILSARELPVQISQIKGRLIGNLEIGRIHYQMKNSSVEMKGVIVEYNPLKLSQKELSIASFHADHVVIKTKPDPNATRKKSMNDVLASLKIPLDISAGQCSVTRFEYHKGKHVIALSGIQGRLQLKDKVITARDLDWSHVDKTFTTSGTVQLAPDLPFQTVTTGSVPKLLHFNLDAQGNLSNYLAKGDYNFSKPGAPAASGKFSGSGDIRGFNFTNLRANTLDGLINLSGDVYWTSGFRAELAYQAEDLSLNSLHPSATVTTDATGTLELNKERIDFKVNPIGTFRDLPLQGEFNGSFEDQRLTLNRAVLRSARNEVVFSGIIDQQQKFSIQFAGELPELEKLYPELSGSAVLQGQAEGSTSEPQLQLDLSLKNISHGNIDISQGHIKVSPTGKTRHHEVISEFRTITFGNQTFDRLKVAAQGDSKQQEGKLSLSTKTPKGAGSIEFSGDYDPTIGTWSGTISNTTIQTAKLPSFVQTEATELSIAKDQQLSPLCLSYKDETVCFNAQRKERGDFQLRTTVERFSVQHLGNWIPELKDLRESLDGELLFVSSTEKQASTFELRLNKENKLTGDISHTVSTGEIGGTVSADFNQLEWINLFTDEVINPSGALHADIKIGGNLDSPALSGLIELTDAAAKLPASGAQLERGTIKVRLQGPQTAKLSAVVHSGEGELKLTGDLSWKRLEDWKVLVDINGENFEAVNQPLARVSVNPDIRVWASREGAAIQGTIMIPKALIELANLPASAVRVSADEIILDTHTGNGKKPYPSHTAVLLKLGDDIQLRGYGLDARFEGKLQLIQHANKSVVGDGVLKIAEGTYTAYGQDLSTEFGQIYFNGPLNSPRLNLLASREIDNITAGIRIVGTLDAPESQVYSIPVMPQTDALSYLLTGKPLRSTREGEANVLVNAAVRLGLKGGAGVINDIRTFADLDTLEIQPGEDLEQSALIIGKYLTADLYLEYISQLFVGSDVISMRYDINNKVQLKAESSDTSKAIDLLYQFETR